MTELSQSNTEVTDALASEKDRCLSRVRAEVGWPENTADYEGFTADLMWRYIEALENQLAAERWVRGLREGRP